ncbi:MAG TPA: ABC transporter ATP-binding protein [Candidatus Paceibacterota bacterium]
MPAPLISIKNASLIYDPGTPIEFKALDDVSLSIYPEEYIIFFGPSGCGKSTLLYAISGLLAVTAGEVNVLGKNLVNLSRTEMVEFHRRSVGMVFQAYYLIQSLSVRANVALPQIFLKVSKQERIKNTERILERFGILEQKGKYPTQLSGGQQQRVAVSRALVNNPPIILADEPVGNLDSKSAESVLELFRQLNEHDKKTVVLVTHNPEYLHFAHRVFYIQDGKIVREVKNPRTQVREEELKPFVSHGLTEIARLFPHLGEDALKSKMLALYLMGELDPMMQDRIEQVIQAFITGKLNKETLAKQLSHSIHDGGIGLYQQRVEELSEELTGIIGIAQYLRKNFGSFPRNYAQYEQILDTVVRYLALTSNVHPTAEQRERFKRTLKGRLEGSLDKNAFEAILDKPLGEGGAGLNIRTARTITRRVELLLLEYPGAARVVSTIPVEPMKPDDIVSERKQKVFAGASVNPIRPRAYPGAFLGNPQLLTPELPPPHAAVPSRISITAPMIYPKEKTIGVSGLKESMPSAPRFRPIEPAPPFIRLRQEPQR